MVSDLLMELQSARAEGDLPGLSFLDTARGVNPIVQELPFRLQEKWASVGASYKWKKCVPCRPFAYFVDFVVAKNCKFNVLNFFSERHHSALHPGPYPG